MKKQIVFIILLFLIGTMFIYASVSKYLPFYVFVSDMHKQPFPSWFSTGLAYALPPFEMLIVLSFIPEKTRMLGLKTAFIVMSLFTLYAAVIYFRIYPVRPCSCGGAIRYLSWGQHFLSNLFFTVISFCAVKLLRSPHNDAPNTSVKYEPA